MDITNLGAEPDFVDSFGGYFSFAGKKRFTVDIDALNNVNDYTVTWCGVKGAGGPYTGLSRGTTWKLGNHLVGWQNGAYFNNQERIGYDNMVKPGDSFCITHGEHTLSRLFGRSHGEPTRFPTPHPLFAVNDANSKVFHIYLNGEKFNEMPWGSQQEVGVVPAVAQLHFPLSLRHLRVCSRRRYSRQLTRLPHVC